MSPESKQRDDGSPASEAIIPSISIEALIAKRDAAIERYERAASLLREASDIAATITNRSSYSLRVDNGRNRDFSTDYKHVTEQLDALVWEYLLDQSGMRTFLDDETKKLWDKAIDTRDVPALTRENIEATFQRLHENRGTMFERGVCEVFRKLSWDYKTNNPRRIGKRLVLRGVVDNFWKKECRPSHDGCNRLDDLIRVCSILDKQPEPDHRQRAYMQLSNAKWPTSGAFTFGDWFTVKGFMNGNAHLAFIRPDIVDELNRIVARHHKNILPPAESE